eukprot:scaffold30431_cov31-Tisochrysis_lutea.AAC.1
MLGVTSLHGTFHTLLCSNGWVARAENKLSFEGMTTRLTVRATAETAHSMARSIGEKPYCLCSMPPSEGRLFPRHCSTEEGKNQTIKR